jgi:hypothetical protein
MFALWQACGHGLTAMTGTKDEKIFTKNTTCVVVPDTDPDQDSDLGF